MTWLQQILAAIIFCSTLQAQLQVRNYFSFSGKKDINVNAIIQDSTGFLVLATSDGAFRFDGKRAEPVCKTQSCLRQEITAAFIDARGVLFLGTRSGKVYREKDGQLDSVNFGPTGNTAKVTSFHQAGRSLVIGTYGNGLFVLNGKLRHLTSSIGLSDDVVYRITGDDENRIWCGTDAGITEIRNLSGNPVFRPISDKHGLPDNIVRDLRYENNRLLISMQDSGVCYYETDSRKILRPPLFSGWTHGAVVNAYSTGPKKLLIGTEKNGLYIINNGVFNIYHYEDYQIPSINQVFYDRAGQIWVASRRGISQFLEKRSHFLTAAQGLPDDKITAITADQEHSLWIGSPKGISRLMRDMQGRIVSTTVPGSEKHTISCAATGFNGNILFGTYGSGILVVNAQTWQVQLVNSANSSLPNDNISNIYIDHTGTALIATLGGGLVKAMETSDAQGRPSLHISEIFDESDGLGSNYVYAAITGRNGRLFVATDGGGLQALEGKKFRNLTKEAGLSSNSVFSLCRDRHDVIWAASNADGILKYDGRKLRTIGLPEGLRDEQPQQLATAGDLVFAVHAKGIDRINCLSNAISYYDIYEGDTEPNLNAICTGDDKFYSGTGHGILVFRTSREKMDSVKPVVYISALELNYKSFPLDSLVEFSHNQNNLSFGFDGIWLKNPEKLQYRYKLDGLESGWLFSSEGKMVNYNNLNPGKYTFMVQVKNEEDVWSELAEYPFIIHPPIWKRWWFWLLVAAFSALGIYSFISFRLRTLQKENLLLEHRVKERTAQIEKQSAIIEEKNRKLEQLSLVASKTDNVVLILDPEGRVEYVNESFTKLHNMNLDRLSEIYGHTIYELSNNKNIRQIISDAVTCRKSVSYESLNRKPEVGREIWESSTLTPIFDDAGNLKKIIIIDTDVSERKKQEQIILQKNKDITDSISYARKIQHAILPDVKLIRQYIPQSFILYMTKDIVSGDFYWFSHFDDHSIIAAVDCTGHGVPGAFMSLIGYNLLNKIVNENHVTDPSRILLDLNLGVLDALHKNESESKDGMDIAICKISHATGTLEYAGAMRPLWIVNNTGLTEIRADKIPIGTLQLDRSATINYTTHKIQAQPGDSFYIFTDGYADQFGGQRDKKYSTARLKKLLTDNSGFDMETQEQLIRAEHQNWKGDNEQVDDILILGFRLGK